MINVKMVMAGFCLKRFFLLQEDRSRRPDLFCEKVFLGILQNSQENTSARVSFLIKLQAPSATLLKKRYGTGIFQRILRNLYFV